MKSLVRSMVLLSLLFAACDADSSSLAGAGVLAPLADGTRCLNGSATAAVTQRIAMTGEIKPWYGIANKRDVSLRAVLPDGAVLEIGGPLNITATDVTYSADTDFLVNGTTERKNWPIAVKLTPASSIPPTGGPAPAGSDLFADAGTIKMRVTENGASGTIDLTFMSSKLPCSPYRVTIRDFTVAATGG
jgi:hypothetical protein